MKILLEHFNHLLSDYVRETLASEAKTPLVKFALGAVGASGVRLENMIPEAALQAFGIIDAEKKVDVGKILDMLRGGFSAAGPVRLFGLLKFDVSDAERFAKYLEERGGENG
ncbi:MAG: hypothetical protein ACI4QT_07135 [Kiritimatiellia bacterium]